MPFIKRAGQLVTKCSEKNTVKSLLTHTPKQQKNEILTLQTKGEHTERVMAAKLRVVSNEVLQSRGSVGLALG